MLTQDLGIFRRARERMLKEWEGRLAQRWLRRRLKET
jgi:hypothetical protein